MAHHNHRHSQNALTLAFWLNLIFSAIEIAGAVYTNSTAILTDAIHDLGDSFAIGLGIVFEKIAGRKPDVKYTYGYKRFSMVSALILSVLLIVGAVGMVIKAVDSFVNVYEVNSEGMFALAVLGIVVNGFAFIRMKQSEKQNHNSKAIMLHFLEDVLGWIAVLLGSMVMYFTKWYWVDGVLSICIAVFIGWNATKNMIETIPIFLQAAPKDVPLEELRSRLFEIKGIVEVESLHVWSLDEDENIGSVRLTIEQGGDTQQVLKAATTILKQYAIHNPAVQVEICQISAIFG